MYPVKFETFLFDRIFKKHPVGVLNRHIKKYDKTINE